MKVTDFTRSCLRNRRWRRDHKAMGYEEYDKYTELRVHHCYRLRIQNVVIAPDGRSVWARIIEEK